MENNEIHHTVNGNSVVLGAWRTPLECSSVSTIKNNVLVQCPESGWSSIAANPYKSGTISVSGNSGCASIGWGDTCIP